MIPVRNSDWHIEQVNGEFVLLDVVRDVFIHANQTAAVILQLCDGQRSVEDITDVLYAAYEDESIRVDVPETIRLLVEQGVLSARVTNKPGD